MKSAADAAVAEGAEGSRQLLGRRTRRPGHYQPRLARNDTICAVWCLPCQL
jgi:hypothetical protein